MEPSAKQIMERELAEVVGPDAAHRTVETDQAEPVPERQTLLAAAWSSRLLIGLLLVAAVVVGAFLSLLTGSWWLLAAVLAVHFVGTTVVLVTVFRLLGDVEAPSPTAVAALEARGVRDPEGELNRLIRSVDDDEAKSTASDLEQDDSAAEAVRRQQASWTPGERSRPVDRGDAR
jgi:hypothetical protein